MGSPDIALFMSDLEKTHGSSFIDRRVDRSLDRTLDLDAEELDLKRELAIREREGKWRARQEELLFQKRMIGEWRQRETERKIEQSRAQHLQTLEDEKQSEATAEERRRLLELKRMQVIMRKDKAREIAEAEKATALRAEALQKATSQRDRHKAAAKASWAEFQTDAKKRATTAAEQKLLEMKREAAMAKLDALCQEKAKKYVDEMAVKKREEAVAAKALDAKRVADRAAEIAQHQAELKAIAAKDKESAALHVKREAALSVQKRERDARVSQRTQQIKAAS